MSTEFRTETTGEMVAVRWFAGKARGACFEFGADPSNAMEVIEAARAGERFVSEFGEVFTGERFEAMVLGTEMTFGEFPVTVEAFSADAFRFAGEK